MNGIKKLRALILELAVRGKLVPQDSNDEPAGELLKRIQIEKAKLVAEGRIKKDRWLPPITDEEKPFKLPQGWEWVRVGCIGHDWGQKTPNTDFTYIEVSAIDSERGIISSPELMRPENAPLRARKVVKKNTIIYSMVRPYLQNIAIIEEAFLPEPIASTAFAIVHPFCLMPSKYFFCFLRSSVFMRYVESVQMGITYPAINDGQFFSGLIPLPPIQEQHRIVAKIDELMALCDQLETQHINAVEAHEKLVSRLLGTLTQSQSADDFNTNWQRITAHFDMLFTTEASVNDLKQTLLHLAVMGKLVPQDPNDEPASELLKRIQAEKAKLVAEGKIKKGKFPLNSLSSSSVLLFPSGESNSAAINSLVISSSTLSIASPTILHFEKGESGGIQVAPKIFGSGIPEEERPLELPQGWGWVSLDEISQVGTGATPLRTKPEYFSPAIISWVTSGETSNPYIFRTEQYVSPLALKETNLTVYPKGTLIVAMYGQGKTRGQIAELKIEAATNQACAAIRLIYSDEFHSKYVKLFFEKIYHEIRELAAGEAQPNLNLSKIKKTILALPPLSEQRRIVTKVDELMNLCDQLKSCIMEANQLQKKLTNVIAEQAIS